MVKKIPPLIWIIIAILLLGAVVVVFTYWMMNRKQGVIPVVKAPAIEKSVKTVPSGPKATVVKTEEGGKSDEDVTPILQEIEKDVGSKSEKEDKQAPEATPAEKPGKGKVVEMSPSGELVTPSREAEPSSEPPKPKTASKGKARNSPESPSKSKSVSSKGEIVEMNPSGELRTQPQPHTQPTRPTTKPKVRHKKRSHTTVAEKKPPPKSGSHPKHKKEKNETLTIDKQIGYFYKSLKKSLKELEHPSGSHHTKGNDVDEKEKDQPVGFEGAFPRR